MPSAFDPKAFLQRRLEARNEASRRFFAREADRLARACQQMAARFLRGGRLLAFGNDHHATDAQHVAVEFVHPVIVGKRALPALDLSLAFAERLPTLVRPDDIVMGFGPPAGDPEVSATLEVARKAGAMTFELPLCSAAATASAEATPPADSDQDAYAVAAPCDDASIHQELIEVLYHTLWETVHVFFEHRELGHDVGQSAFLYPFLGSEKQDTSGVVAEVAASILTKASEDEELRAATFAAQADSIVGTAAALQRWIADGATLLFFGNGGSATDANDWALDCALPAGGGRSFPAVSLAAEAANLSAIANDIGAEAIFLRQLIAQARPSDVAIGISTSGGSGNVLLALEEARKRGMLTVALLGYDGGEVVRRGLADHAIVVDCDYIPRIQEIQASVYHALLELLREAGETTIERRREEPGRPATAGGIELFGGASCPFTAELREHLELEGAAFVEHDVEGDAAARRRLVDLLAGERGDAALRVPVLVEDGEVRQVGYQGRSCPVAAGPAARPAGGPADDGRRD